ncbi:MAG: hypothetical protein EOO77_30740 [Oxalobacteraceae bacterium]|nr:MAG: hypothetical protein EOO77_30740 [Oxalobacteraceae bacterium]
MVLRLLPLLLALTGPARAADPLRFWNLTGETVSSLTLAPTGTTNFGSNQCANDKDGTVDNDERLRLSNVTPGHYDIRIGFQKGRMCEAHDVTLKPTGKYAFSLDQKDLKNCK